MTLQLNPIIMREARARWRGGRPFLLLLAYAGLLATIICFAYGWTVLDPYRSTRAVRHSSIIGHELFMHLTWVQTLAWVLLGPALTAPVIAGERERGLLEGLQLSPLSPWRIILGKLGAAMAFMAMMMLAPLPVIAIRFMLGGVSPGEFWWAVLLQLSIAVAGASLGLACSSRSHRAGAAFSRTYACIILWGISSFVAIPLAMIPAGVGGLNLWPWVRDLCSLFGLTNPIIAALSITNQDLSAQIVPATFAFWWDVVHPAAVCIVFCVLFSLFLLWFAMRAVRKPLPEQHWIELKPQRQDITATETAREQAGAGRSRRRVRHRSTARWEIPLLSRLYFSNPVLQREIRARTRLRQMSKLHLWTTVCFVLIIVYAYYRLMSLVITDPLTRGLVWQMLSVITVIGFLLASSLMGANSLAREREAGTWEAVNLSLLSPWQIVSGKLFVILAMCSASLVLLMPLLLSCINFGSTPMDDITPLTALMSFLLLGVTGWCYAAYGMLLSWLCRRTITAISWTISTLVIVLCFVPILIVTLDIYTDPLPTLAHWHPALTMGFLSDPKVDDSPVAVAWFAIGFLLIVGCFCLSLLCLLIRRGIRERDGRFRENISTGAGSMANATLPTRQT